jgi:preprotein translocase subunit Sec63
MTINSNKPPLDLFRLFPYIFVLTLILGIITVWFGESLDARCKEQGYPKVSFNILTMKAYCSNLDRSISLEELEK